MLILGIESSCDETAIALVRDGKTVINSEIASQIDLHAKWGGVIPEIAAREHLNVLQYILRSSLEKAKVNLTEIDAIAVTQGPGLIGCLLVGVSFAKGLAQSLEKPLIPVNHVHAHIHGALLGVQCSMSEIFPTLALVVSGGHTNLYYLENPTSFELLAHTIDDACGESFDKVGKMLGLPYPGGPHVERLAAQAKGSSSRVVMPKMMAKKSQMAFSYSGLKTAVSLHLKAHTTEDDKIEVAYAFQNEALGQLVRKLSEAYRLRPMAKSILVAGGVAANQKFRTLMSNEFNIPTLFPDLKYCSDNGAMIASLGYYEFQKDGFKSGYDWDVFSRYPFESFMSKHEKDH